MAQTKAQTGKHPQPPFPKPTDQEKPGDESKLRPRPKYEAPEYHPANKLAGRRALITGGDSGIGRAAAVLFAKEGADVALVYLPVEQNDAEETKRHVEQEGRKAVLIPGDVRDPDFCQAAVQRTVDELGGLDILVNNAAYQQHHESFLDIPLEEWDRTFKTNIYGYFYMARFAVPQMPPGSTIINTGSITGLQGSKGLTDYSATKGAIHALTKTLAQELIDREIRVNCIAPGPVWTPLNPAERDPEEVQQFGAGTPYGRPAQPEEIAPLYVYFASNGDSSYVTGEVVTLLGGKTRAG